MGISLQVWHRISGYKWRGLVPADEIIPLLEEFRSRKDIRFSYHLARIDDVRGGVMSVGEAARSLPRRKLANLWELDGYYRAIKSIAHSRDRERWNDPDHEFIGCVGTEIEIARYKEALATFERAYNLSKAKVSSIRNHDKMIGEMDLVTKQILIAGLSAVGSIASAVAAAIAAYISFINR